MRIYENDTPRINIRSRFNFDSDAPVQGQTFDENKAEAKRFFYDKAVHNLAAVNVVLGGWWLMSWWYHGGFLMMKFALNKWVSYLLTMTEYGFLG